MEIVVIAVILGLIPGIIAERKGYNAFLWWLFGSLLFILALPISLLLTTKPEGSAKEKVGGGPSPVPALRRIYSAGGAYLPLLPEAPQIDFSYQFELAKHYTQLKNDGNSTTYKNVRMIGK